MKILTSAVFGFAVLSATALAEPPEGNWISQDGGTKVRRAQTMWRRGLA
jgi:hypothetical protein